MTESTSLLRRFLLEEPAAVRHVEEVIRRVVRAHGRRIPREAHEDIVQDTVLAVLKGVADDQDPDAIRDLDGFVARIAQRMTINWMRQKRCEPLLAERLEATGLSAEERLLEQERFRIGSRVLAVLRPRCREVLNAHYAHGRSYDDIAREMNTSAGALRVLVNKCKTQAREIFGRIQAGTSPGIPEETA